MSLVFAGVCSHAPGITGRADRAEPDLKDGLYASFDRMRDAIKESGAETLVVVAAEHFANFFMDNMPAYCIGMADDYQGPIEDEKWLGIKRRTIPGNPDLSHRLIKDIMQDVDVSYAQEWKFDHGIMVPLHFLAPDNDMDIIPVNINCQGPPLTPCTEHGRLEKRSAVPLMRHQKKLLWLAQAVFPIGLLHRTQAKSMNPGIRPFSKNGPPTTRMPCSPTATRSATPRAVKAHLKFAPSSPLLPRVKAVRVTSGSTLRYQFTQWDAP